MPDEPAAPATGTEGEPTEPATPAPEPTEAEPKPEPKPTETVDFWKQKARDQEKRAKANANAATELEHLKASMMSEQEKAVEAARSEGRKEATLENGKLLAAAKIEAALTSIVPDPTAIVEDLDLSRYVTADGVVDLDEVTKLRGKYEGLASKTPGRDPDFGARTPAAPAQSPDAQMDAFIRGRLGR